MTEQQQHVPGPDTSGSMVKTPQNPEVAAIVEQTLASLMGQMGGGAQTFEEALAQVDPRDSEAALQMLDWLLTNARLHRLGTLDRGGYLFAYQEPKGSTKEGYTPGATQGDRIVDKAVEEARASGAAPKGRATMCKKCFSAVVIQEDGTALLDGDGSAICSAGGAHDPA